MDLGDHAESISFLTRDRGAYFTDSSDAVFQAIGVHVIPTLPQVPRMNAIAEHWTGSCRREATDRALITGERHLRLLVGEYTEHYNRHRPHRSFGQRAPDRLNQDAEANNVLLHASGPADARLIDFEFASFTHALTDAVCLYVPGPALLTVGDSTTTGLADHYRHALSHGIPEAEDDQRYGDGLAAACVSWALVRLQRLPLLDTRSPGDHSRLQLIATLEAAAHTAQSHRALPHLTAWIRRIAAVLRRRWPDADQDFIDPAGFPPYRARL
ncbi:integrase core domain-containing protein [Streptomyces sp. NPDC059474]|uniref:integrase core domain-containing protein n=1 Tax=Streptomyces sp. NPDC059474 TaxID=3346846 RepID=UPI00369D505B